MLDTLEAGAAATGLPLHPPLARQHGRRARILVVDDEPSNLEQLDLMLRSEGYERVELVQDPREVIGRYCSERPDLILLDIDMPHLDGHAVMQQLAAIGDAAPPPIVVLTAPCGDETLRRALKGGATDFLGKPFTRSELLARVHNILLAHQGSRLMHDHDRLLRQRVHGRTQALRLSRLDLVRRLGRASEPRDDETSRHILRMSHASALLARRLGWDDEACELMLNASAMHDIGNIGVPERILLNPGPLTHDERELMKTHTEIGAEILGGSGDELIEMARDIALSHHERWDGNGYPRRLAGTLIPEAARIVAITDVFDALTSVRPYRQAWPVAEAVEFMANSAGTHFDPWLVQTFLTLLPQIQEIRDRFDAPPPLPASRPPDAR